MSTFNDLKIISILKSILSLFLIDRDLGLSSVNKLDNRPSLEEVAHCFKKAKYTAYIGATVLTAILIIVWPAIQVTTGIFSESDFTHWVSQIISSDYM